MQKTWRPALLVVLCLLGAGVAAYLTAIHLRFLASGVASACNVNQTFNCDAVNTSAWSEIGGVPVSHLGLLFYLALAGLGVVTLVRPSLRPRLHGYLLLLGLLGGGFSLFLAAVSLRLGVFCLFCISLYGVNLGLLAILLPGGFAPLRQLGVALPSDLGALFRRPAALLLGLLALFGAAVSSYQLRQALQVGQATARARQQAAVQAAQQESVSRIDLVDPAAPSLGPANAAVTIVEVSDFECPFCQRAAQTILALRQRYPTQLRIVFRNFPLDQSCNSLLKRQIHPSACAAAQAALCAGEQGQFWPYAERLFAGDTDADDLPAHAKALGLVMATWQRCLADPATSARVAADIAACAKVGVGVSGVPVFLVNGRKLAGAQPIEAFQALIDDELARQR